MKFNSGNSIGLLGGTFDPIHLGHLHIIETLAGKFDQIALIPTGQPWMKPETPIAKPKQRLGTDAAFSFNKWKRPEDIKKMAEILVVKRPGAKPSDFKELEVNAPDISSTDVREELAATGKTTKVSKSVMAYIKKNGLYGSK